MFESLHSALPTIVIGLVGVILLSWLINRPSDRIEGPHRHLRKKKKSTKGSKS